MASACGPFSQTLFLGASITKASCSLGWNGDSGRLSVELLEDSCRDSTRVYYDTYGNVRTTTQPDFFNPPKVGHPIYFKLGNLTYGGILQNWEQNVSPDGGKVYTVNCIDPVEILEGTNVIINNYTGQIFNVPNLINAFGYIQSLRGACNVQANLASLNPPIGYVPAQGYGGNDITSEGMTWFDIKNAIMTLGNSPSSSYGGMIQLRDTRYYIDISELPELDSSFRISGDSVTLLELISQVCQAVGYDYFIELIYATPGNVNSDYSGTSGHLHPDVMKFIKVRIANRRVQKLSAYNVDVTVGSPVENRLSLGTITRFIGNGNGTNRSNRGLELRSDVTNVFLVGDNRRDLWQQPYSGDGDGLTDTIWPFWGFDELNFPLRGQGFDSQHQFTINTTNWGPEFAALNNAYTINIAEIRAALAGYEEWSVYMHVFKNDIFTALELDSSFDVVEMMNFIIANPNAKPRPQDWKNTAINQANTANRRGKHLLANNAGRTLDEIQQFLFEQVKSYAENYGKKFLVSLPLICAQSDDSTPFGIKLNWKPVDAAWTDAAIRLHPSIPNDEVLEQNPTQPNNLFRNGTYLDKFRNEEGLIECFVYFNTGDDDKKIDYSKIDVEDVLQISDTECYVRARVEQITFMDPLNLRYARAIVSINQPITIISEEDEDDIPIWNALLVAFGQINGNDFQDWVANNMNIVGNDTNLLSYYPLALLPKGAAVPLISDNLSYGPWFTSLVLGPAAKTVYERDTSFSPWSFGSTSNMNNGARIKVETAVTQQIVNEAGSVTLPGSPLFRLGATLQAGGPEITNIDVSTDVQGGVTTNVRFRTFVQNFGELGRRRVENLRKFGTQQQKLQRAFRKINVNGDRKQTQINLIKELTKSDRFNRNSSHTLLAAQQVEDYENTNHFRTTVVMTDERKLMPEIVDDYENKAMMDMNGMFRPFCTQESSYTDFPCFKQVTPTDSKKITDVSLNPFKSSEEYYGDSDGHDIEIVSRAEDIEELEDFNIKRAGEYSSDIVRAVGLRGPVVIVGWGFDTKGKPVPNENPSNPTENFYDDYLRRPDKWKAGPLDVRWDEERGVWKASGGSSVKRAVLKNILHYRDSAYASGIYYDSNLGKDIIDDPNILLYDFLLKNNGHCLGVGTNVFYTEEEQSGRLYVVNASC